MEGEGRVAYLKARSSKGPQEKFGRAVTEARLLIIFGCGPTARGAAGRSRRVLAAETGHAG